MKIAYPLLATAINEEPGWVDRCRALRTDPPARREADPCAAYRAYAKAGYPRGPARVARALGDRLDTILTPGVERRIRAAGARMQALGISRADAEAFSSLAD